MQSEPTSASKTLALDLFLYGRAHATRRRQARCSASSHGPVECHRGTAGRPRLPWPKCGARTGHGSPAQGSRVMGAV